MNNIIDLINRIEEFRQKRDWKKFHKAKDVAISLVLEASELLEHFQWKTDDEVKRHTKNHKREISEELADVFYWVLLLSHDLGIDIVKALHDKIALNEKKYPVEKAKGTTKKYNRL